MMKLNFVIESSKLSDRKWHLTGGMIGRTKVNLSERHHIDALSTTNTTWTALVMNQGLHGDEGCYVSIDP